MKLHKLGAGCVMAAASFSYVVAQTQIDLRTQAKRVDFSNASSTKPSKTGIVLPALCTAGETFLKLDANPGTNLYVCTAANVWTVQGSPLPDYVAGSYGKVLTNDDTGMGWESLGGDVAGAPDALTVTKLQGRSVAPAAPSSGHVLSWDGTQWSPQAVQMPALTGDVTTSAGGTVTTLNSVNAGPGMCGDATHVCQVTTNGKGLVIEQTPVAVSASSGGISALNGLSTGSQNFVNDTNVTISSAGSNHTLGWNGVLGLARGGLNANLSNTGGAHQVLQQSSTGVPVTVGQLTSGDISGLAASATTDATNAANITSGTLPNARLSSVPNTALANSSVTVAAGNGLSGGGAAALGGSVTLNSAVPVNAQAGTSYTVAAGDGGKLVTFNNASAVSVTLPQATGAFGAGWYARVRNLGTGAVTITPVTSTIDGAGSVVLQSGQGVMVASDGTNYQTWRGYTWQPSAAGSHQFATGISGAGAVMYAQPAAADITGLAASATTDATNASNITSGTLGAARLPAALSNSTSVNGTAIPASAALMTTGTVLAAAQEPAHTGDVTNAAGSLTLTAGKINGTSVPVNAAADQTLVTTAVATGTWAGVPNCGDATHALAYSTSTHGYSCQAITATATPGGAAGQVQYNNGGALGGLTIGGDAALNTGTGALTVIKTNGANFAASATTDATNAANITSGTLPNARLSSVPNTALANPSVTVAAGNGLSGGGAAALGGSVTLNSAVPVNAQAGTSYTVAAGDGGKLVTFNNASAVSVTLPQATGAFGAGWYTRVRNLGTGAVTITPVTSTIDGAGSVVLQSGQGVMVASDGTNYQTWRGYTWQPSAAGSHQFATGISGAGAVTYAQPAAADITGLAPSATTDATNAANITSGTMGAARMPQFTGGQVTSPAAGSAVLNIGAGSVTNAMLAGSIDASTKLTGITPATNGGTGNGYTAFSGPAGSVKTYSLPNASTTIVTTQDTGSVTNAMLAGSIATSKLANLQGADANILTAGTVSGTGALLCTDASGGATTSGCSAGAGTVTVVGSGNLTGAALVTGGGSQALQTPAATATMDASGNIQTPGVVQAGYGSSNAGAWAFMGGTATAAPANSVGFQAPTAVTSAYRITLPAAPAAGFVKRTNSTPSLESVAAIAAADLPTFTSGAAGAVPASGGGTANFLRADGTWIAPAGSGTVTTSGTPSIHQVAIFSSATAITGVAVGATDKPLVGVTNSDPVFSKVTLTNPATGSTLTVADGKTLTASNTLTFTGTDSSSVDFGSGGSVTYTIASGQTAMPTAPVAANSCSASATTATATNAATTDVVAVSYASDPTSVTGYGGGTGGGISIRYWPAANAVKFKLCNETGASITPGALNINWRVTR